jgi:tRNA threonylcarbamoyladenosine biosynthesis protein TsaE
MSLKNQISMHTIELSTLLRTETMGILLGKVAEPGDIITLAGTLGAGKTALTQAIGRGLGVDSRIYITSPTFSLLHEYQARIPLYHMDLYRLGSEEEIESLGFPEYFYGYGFIELIISGEISRTAHLYAHGELWQKKVADIVSMV